MFLTLFKVYFKFSFTSSTNTFAGLKAGIWCAGIIIVVFFLIFLPVFSALFFGLKVPNPLKNTASLDDIDSFISFYINA